MGVPDRSDVAHDEIGREELEIEIEHFRQIGQAIDKLKLFDHGFNRLSGAGALEVRMDQLRDRIFRAKAVRIKFFET